MGAVAAGLVLGLGLLNGCGGTDTYTPAPSRAGTASTAGTAATAETRLTGAQRVLDELVEAVTTGDESAADRIAAAPGREQVAAAIDNATTLGLSEVSVRVIDAGMGLTSDLRREYGDDAWRAAISLGYRLGPWDSSTTRLETEVVFVGDAARPRIRHLGTGSAHTPLWLAGPVDVAHRGRVLVIARDSDAADYLDLGRRAISAVRAVLGTWHGRLVLEVPAGEDELERALDAPAGRYSNIAAVTTTVNGTLVTGTPVHVFVNPDVFDGLGPEGAQIVISHEATHVSTGATFAPVPSWLLEGFADYVSLVHSGIGVDQAGSQALDRIRDDGLPEGLPTSADLDPGADELGATYELAWLANRFIAAEHGEARLVRLYRKVSGGTPVADAFTDVLGVSEADFVGAWRDDLARLAGVDQ